jgi:hypothetical protein
LYQYILKYNKTFNNGTLPIKDGTISADLFESDIDASRKVDNENVLAISCGAAGRWLSFDFKSGAIYPMTLDLSLGGSATKWTNVFTKKLNNGADLIVPTEGGTLARLEDLEGIGGGDYLPLSGGTMTGPLEFDMSGSYAYAPVPFLKFSGQTAAYVTANGSATGLSTSISWVGIHGFSEINITTQIGQSYNKVPRIYVNKLNNGADLAVPTEAGTLARIEDLDERIGDISTALTAILGE